MPAATADPELGVHKKDDDLYFKGGRKRTSSLGWKAAPRIAPRKTLKRLGLLVLIATAAYLFIHNIPTDVGPRRSSRPSYPTTLAPPGLAPKPQAPSAIEIVDEDEGKAGLPSRDYNGPVRFLELAETLHAISGTHGGSALNKNVLYAASSLKSAGSLLPLACKMGRELRAYVHFALISRSEIPMDELRAINGIDTSCEIIFHGRSILSITRNGTLFFDQPQMRALNSPASPPTRDLQSPSSERSIISTTTCTLKQSLWIALKRKILYSSNRYRSKRTSSNLVKPS